MLAIYARTSREQNQDETSTIEQQIRAGIDFANSHHYEYEIYQDKGISGYKLSESDSDPYTNRPEMTRLIDDIKAGKIEKVWVWEHSRLSRNTYSSAAIFNIFSKYKVELFEKTKKVDFENSSDKFMRQIMDAVAEYERNLIVGRTTRGLYNAIDSGKRTYAKFFGYKEAGRNESGYKVFIPVDSELERLKYAYKQVLSGASLRSVSKTFFDSAVSDSEVEDVMRKASKLGRFLRHCEYTGKVLTTEGLQILHDYEEGKIQNLAELLNEKYWVNHAFYNVQLITIPEWIKVKEQLQQNKIQRKNSKKRSSKDSIGTGLLKCAVCGSSFYNYNNVQKYKGKTSVYRFYSHVRFINKQMCSNQKTIKADNFDTMLNLFYYYFTLYFDTSNKEYESVIEDLKIKSLAEQEEIKSQNQEIKKIEKTLAKFNDTLEKADDMDVIKVVAKQISKKEAELDEAIEKLHKLEEKKNKIESLIYQNEYEKTMFSLKERLNSYFDNDNSSKNSILQKYEFILDEDSIFIKANTTLFVFNKKIKYKFDESLLKQIEDDEQFQDFVNISKPFGYGCPVYWEFSYAPLYAPDVVNTPSERMRKYMNGIESAVLMYMENSELVTMFFREPIER